MKKKLLPVLLLAIILLASCVSNQTTPNLTEYSISDSSEEPDHTTAATNLTQKTKTLTVGNLNLQYNDDYTIMEQSSDYADLTGVEDTKIFVMHDYSTITIEQLFESLIPDEIEYEIIEDNQTEINGVI